MGSESTKPIGMLGRTSSILADIHANSVAEWSPEEPPETEVLGEMGRVIVEREAEYSDDELKAIFLVVEEVFLSGSDQEESAVATGFLEAVLSATDFNPRGGTRVLSFAGSKTRAYCAAWNAFCGVEDSALAPRDPGLGAKAKRNVTVASKAGPEHRAKGKP